MKDDRLADYLDHMRQAAADACNFVGGMTRDEFLKDKPTFAEIVSDMREFFDGAKWVAHNANFDIGFINYVQTIFIA